MKLVQFGKSKPHKRDGFVDFYYFIYLCNRVFRLNDGQDSLLLDGGRFFESEGVDTT